MTDQGSATPILRDMGKHPMFNLIPLTGPRRQMAHRNGQAQRIGQALQLRLPQPCAPAVTAARIGDDQQRLYMRIGVHAHLSPSLADRRDRKFSGIMVGTDADPAQIGRHIIDTIGDRLPGRGPQSHGHAPALLARSVAIHARLA